MGPLNEEGLISRQGVKKERRGFVIQTRGVFMFRSRMWLVYCHVGGSGKVLRGIFIAKWTKFLSRRIIFARYDAQLKPNAFKCVGGRFYLKILVCQKSIVGLCNLYLEIIVERS